MLLQQKCALPYTIYSCDDASTDGTADIIRTFPAVKIIQRPDGEYFPGRTLNHMIRSSAGDIVVFNNADAIPQNDHWLQNLIAPLLADEADAVYANQLPRPDAQWLVRKDSERAFGDGKIAATWRFFFSLASSATRRDDLLAHPFDETFKYSEDIEWAHRRKIRIKYAPDAIVEHSHNYTPAQLKKRFYGEGFADQRIFNAIPSIPRCLAGALRETLRDAIYLLKHPRGLGELPGALRRRWIQKFAYRRGAMAAHAAIV
jgi:rhamnosyltransferase